KPQGAHPARTPAVVMMHGRAGPYSSAANGVYDASTLSKRHQEWGHIWAQQGYLAILVDGFGPRGYPQGFPRFSYDSRPETLNEVTVRPLDAYGALTYRRAGEIGQKQSTKHLLDHPAIRHRAGNEVVDGDALVVAMPLLDRARSPHCRLRTLIAEKARIERAVTVEHRRRGEAHAPTA